MQYCAFSTCFPTVRGSSHVADFIKSIGTRAVVNGRLFRGNNKQTAATTTSKCKCLPVRAAKEKKLFLTGSYGKIELPYYLTT